MVERKDILNLLFNIRDNLNSLEIFATDNTGNQKRIEDMIDDLIKVRGVLK